MRKNNFYLTVAIIITVILLSGISFNILAQNQYYLDFDGSNDYGYRIDNSVLDRMNNASEYTIEAWIYIPTWVDYQRIANRYSHWDFYLRENGQLAFRVLISGTWYLNYSSNNAVSTGSWQHVAVIRKSSSIKFYVNGVDVSSGSYSGKTLPGASTNDHLYIGQYGSNTAGAKGTNLFKGYIDELRCKNEAVNVSDLHCHKYDNEYLPDSHTGALFHFNEGTGTNIKEETQGYNGKIYGTPTWRSWNYVSTKHLPLAYEWLGANTDWATTSNWNSSAAPGSTNNVIIPSTTNDPEISSTTTANCNDLKIIASATLTVSGSITIDGTTTNNGSMVNNGTMTINGTTSFTGSSAQTIPGNATFSDLSINNSAGVSLNDDITVNGTLTITSGNLNLAGKEIDLGSSGSLSETGGLIVDNTGGGSIKATRSLNAPSSENVAGLGAIITSSANLGSTEVKRTCDVQTGNSNDGIKRTYEITPTTNSGLNATLRFSYDDSELNGLTESKLHLYRSTDGGATWTYRGGTVNTTDNYIELPDIDAFSTWTAGDDDNPLPVKLISFNAIAENNTVILKWKTASEINNDYFTVERSSDGKNWSEIGEIKGHGNSNTVNNYSYLTENTMEPVVYFRLKQTDYNGEYEYSKIITIANKSGKEINIYPNPFVSEVVLENVEPGSVIRVKNNLGIILNEIVQENNAETLRINFEDDLPTGVYFIYITGNNQTRIYKIIKR